MTSVQHNDASFVKIDGINIAYETMGSQSADPLLLVSGLGDQLISWPEGFCERLAAEGYRVIRFDNRDSGLSTRLHQVSTPNLLVLIWSYATGKPVRVPYSLEDMASDATAVLDVLEISAAHIVGGSLGGIIAETIAVQCPRRVKTLTVLMTPMSGFWYSLPKPRALTFFTPSPPGRAAYIEQAVRIRRALRGTRFPFDEAHVRQRARSHYDRNPTSSGVYRQIAAAVTSMRRLNEELSSIVVPTLVIHGSADPLVPVKHAVKTARVIPGARLLIIDGLGHEFPPQVWPQVVSAIAAHAM